MDNATAWVMSHRKRILTNISSVAMLIVIFGLFGAFDFLTMTFDFSRLKDLAYWSHILARVIGLICAFNIAVNMFQPYAENRNMELQRDKVRYDRLVRMKTLTFEPYIIKEFNVREKKKAWVSRVNKRIHNLGLLANDKSRMLWGDDRPEYADQRKGNRYCRKRAVLEEMKTEEWMSKNIDTITIRGFRTVDPTAFDLSIDGRERYNGRKINSNTAGARATKTGTMILSTILIGILTTIWGIEISQAIISGSKEEIIQSVIAFLLDVGFLIAKFLQGMFYSDKLVEDEIHRAYVDRIAILQDYLNSDQSPISDYQAQMRAVDAEADAQCESLRDKAKRKASEDQEKKVETLADDKKTREDMI